jgi:glucoamylase
MNQQPLREAEPAPGRPGIAPTWTSSAKDMVTTTIGPSRVWATVGHGIINAISALSSPAHRSGTR